MNPAALRLDLYVVGTDLRSGMTEGDDDDDDVVKSSCSIRKSNSSSGSRGGVSAKVDDTTSTDSRSDLSTPPTREDILLRGVINNVVGCWTAPLSMVQLK